MKLWIVGFFLVLLSTISFAKDSEKEATFDPYEKKLEPPESQLESLNNRADNKMYENQRNPAMVKSFQSVGEDKRRNNKKSL